MARPGIMPYSEQIMSEVALREAKGKRDKQVLADACSAKQNKPTTTTTPTPITTPTSTPTPATTPKGVTYCAELIDADPSAQEEKGPPGHWRTVTTGITP